MRVIRVALLFSVLLVPSIATAEQVPKARLAKGIYTSPGGEYSVKVPELIGPHIEERRISPVTTGVFFADDFGRTSYILLIDNRELKATLDDLSNEYVVGDLLREKSLTTTARGTELRLLGMNRGASPLVTRTKENGKTVERPNDLIEAWSIFLHGDHVYQAVAGVTPIEGMSETTATERAKLALETLLGGLDLKK